MADCLDARLVSVEHFHILNGPFELRYQHLIIPKQQRQRQQAQMIWENS